MSNVVSIDYNFNMPSGVKPVNLVHVETAGLLVAVCNDGSVWATQTDKLRGTAQIQFFLLFQPVP